VSGGQGWVRLGFKSCTHVLALDTNFQVLHDSADACFCADVCVHACFKEHPMLHPFALQMSVPTFVKVALRMQVCDSGGWGLF